MHYGIAFSSKDLEFGRKSSEQPFCHCLLTGIETLCVTMSIVISVTVMTTFIHSDIISIDLIQPSWNVRAIGSKRDARWDRYSPFPGVLEASQRGEMVGAANVAVHAGLPGGQVRSRRKQLKWGTIVCRAGAGVQAWKTNKTNVQNMPDKPQGALKNGTLTKLNLHKTALNGNKRLLWQQKLTKALWMKWNVLCC